MNEHAAVRAQSFRHRAREAVNGLLKAFDLQLVRRSELAGFLGEATPDDSAYGTVPAEVHGYLTHDNPRLIELRERYRRHPAAVHSKWSPEFVREAIDLRLFRRDNAYVYQTRQRVNDATYVLTAYHARKVDRLGLWNVLIEDGAFGCHLVDFNGEVLVSRDLLDSIIEISFIEQELQISRMDHPRFIDVGAGYGRRAHRLCEALPCRVMCADAVPESTFLSEFYLRHRKVDDRAQAIPLDEIEKAILEAPPSIATNIHSFSEMPAATIAWWVRLLARAHVRWLMIVPNTGEDLLSTEAETSERGRGPRHRIDFADVIRDSGYRLVTKRAKHEGAPSLQKHALFPTWYFLFELA